MVQAEELLSQAYKVWPMANDARLLVEKKQQIPGGVPYHIVRYARHGETQIQDAAQIIYEYNGQKSKDSFLQLNFCVAGNMYCQSRDCSQCSIGKAHQCGDGEATLDLVSVRFSPAQLSQFIKAKPGNTWEESLLKFKHKHSFEKTMPVCCRIKNAVEGLVNHRYSGSMENIYVNTQTHMLLLFCLDWASGNAGEQRVGCRFLTKEIDRSKIVQARELLLQHIGEPITIRELSRKVAMNECYLKKGFKEMYGSTIFDFYQNQRMQHAKYLLYDKGLSVTEVSLMLGYSSISHFSTAFKKQTGLKPCELLLRQ
ncbi:MAG: AraC family transcriptional regulator [Niabella sp.]